MSDSTRTAYEPPAAVARDPTGAAPRPAATSPAARVAALELDGIAHRLGHRWALRGVTLRVEPGEVVAVVGPNGSGKTTLLRVIATTLSASRGSGRVFGYDLASEAEAVREVTGMLGHATGLYDDLTAAENLLFAQRMFGRSAASSNVDAVLAGVGMAHHAGQVVRGFSAGMRRRVALARLLLRRPRLLLLDEPYNSFDASGVELVDALVRDTVRSGGAALVVTHDLSRLAATGCDRVVAMSAGRVCEEQSGAVAT